MYSLLKNYIKRETSISEEHLDLICSYFKKVETKRNEIIIGFDDVCSNYYFINKGCIRLYTINSDGTENSRYFAFEGMLCTALPSFIDQKPASEYLQTIEKTQLLVITRVDFYKLVERFSKFGIIHNRILELAFISAQQRIYGFQGFDAFEKVKWIIKNQPHFLLRVSNKMAASYLGISPSTLSRVKSKL